MNIWQELKKLNKRINFLFKKIKNLEINNENNDNNISETFYTNDGNIDENRTISITNNATITFDNIENFILKNNSNSFNTIDFSKNYIAFDNRLDPSDINSLGYKINFDFNNIQFRIVKDDGKSFFGIDPINTSLFINDINNNYAGFSFSIFGGLRIYDKIFNKGFFYDEDYSANFELNSLVTKKYVDTQINNNPNINIYNTDSTLLDNRKVFLNNYELELGSTLKINDNEIGINEIENSIPFTVSANNLGSSKIMKIYNEINNDNKALYFISNFLENDLSLIHEENGVFEILIGFNKEIQSRYIFLGKNLNIKIHPDLIKTKSLKTTESIFRYIKEIQGNYNVIYEDYILLCDTKNDSVIITISKYLSKEGRILIIKDKGFASNNSITINSYFPIEGNNSYVLNTNFSTIKMVFFSDVWYIIP